MKYDFTLCQNNNFVQAELREIKKKINKSEYLPLWRKVDVITIIDKCLIDLRIMKKQGQSLEKRCKKYKRAIEGLGFERK